MRSWTLRMFHWPETVLLSALSLSGLLMGMSMGQSLDPAPRAVAAPSTLDVRLQTDKNSYRLGDEVEVEVLLKNTSRTPLYLYARLEWGQSASLSLWLNDAISGKNVPQDFTADALTPPPSSKERFIKLLPDHVYGVVLHPSLADLGAHRKGTFELVAEYHSPIPSSMSFGLPIWGREKGTISSNRVKIAVAD